MRSSENPHKHALNAISDWLMVLYHMH